LLIDTVGTNEEFTSLEEVATQQQLQQTNPPVTMDQQLPDLAAKLTNPASSSTANEDISTHAVDSLDSFQQQAKATHNEESYDNLNSAGLIEASYIVEDDEEQESYDNNDKQAEASLREELSLVEANARPMDDQALNDFLNKSNTTSFIFANGRYMSKSQFATGGSASSHSSGSNQPNQNDTNLVSEEIEDDEEEAAGQTTMSEDMLRTFDSYVAGEGANEDEFFLISTPSPYGLVVGARQLEASGGEAEEGEDDDEDDEDEDEVYDQQLHQKPVNMLR